MTENCKNCNEVITGNFCANCGQKKYAIIDKKYLLEEIQNRFLITNKGLLFSVKNMLKNPGKTAKEFIDGKRVDHYRPLLLTFVLGGIAIFLSYTVLGVKGIMTSYYSQKNVHSKLLGDFMTILSSYNSLITILLVPFYALTTKIAFRKWGHNYYEHIVMNSYIFSYHTLINILFLYPILFFFKYGSPSIFYNVSQISILLVPVILVWFFKGFYAEKPFKAIILKSLIVICLNALAFFLMLMLIVIVVVVNTM